jgi:hypothetical protein
MKSFRVLRGLVKTNPLLILDMTRTFEMNKMLESYLPYSTGIEIEISTSNLREFGVVNEFITLKNNGLLLDFYFELNEFKFRIPNGLNGMVGLYHVCNILQRTSGINTQSGIHYHVDFTDMSEVHTLYPVITFVKKVILRELDTWNYIGNYNAHGIGNSKRNWIRFPTQCNTIEYRIGEMSFDYEVLINRILHTNSLTKRLKHKLTH